VVSICDFVFPAGYLVAPVGAALAQRVRLRSVGTGRRSKSEPLTVWHEYAVVDEAHADAVRERQTTALITVLRWLAENRRADPAGDGPGDGR
jgi:hypothetical protein